MQKGSYMFQTDDLIIDPAQAWDYYKTEKNSKRINNCPIWNRLSGWAGSSDAACIMMGAHDTARAIVSLNHGDMVQLLEYAKKVNKNIKTLAAIISGYGVEPDKKSPRMYSEKKLDALCEKYWPPDDAIQRYQAIGIVIKPGRLPKPVWTLGCLKYYNREECVAIKARTQIEKNMHKEYNLKMRHERSRLEKIEYKKRMIAAAAKKEKTVKPIAIRVIHNKPNIVIPEGYISVPQACKKYNIRTSTMNRAYHRKIVNGIKIDKSLYVVEKEARDYGERLNKPIPQIPDGWISSNEARALVGMKQSTYGMLKQRKKFPSMAIKNTSYVDKAAFLRYVQQSKRLSKQLQLL